MPSFQSLDDQCGRRSQRYGRWLTTSAIALLTVLVALVAPLRVEAAPESADHAAWLRYDPIDQKVAGERYGKFPAVVVTQNDSPLMASAREELLRGVRGILGRTMRVEKAVPKEAAVLLVTFDEVKQVVPSLEKLPKIEGDGYWLKSLKIDGQDCIVVAAPNERGVLYGVFALLRKLSLAQPISALNERSSPAAPIRAVLHWDRLDGSVPRANGDKSIFWDAAHTTNDLATVSEYGRLLASIGINGLAVNEPSSGPKLMTSEGRKELVKLAGALRPWGVRLFITLNSTSPPPAGNDASPDQAAEAERWKKLVDETYADLPDLGGFVLDADWAAGGRGEEATATRAAAINAIAAALQPHEGLVICRTCVCSYVLDRDDTEDPDRDPAKVAYELFQPLDGRLADNVVLQIKHGPTDFQVREPASPLFGGLEKTNQAIELQLTQQHLGQQRHLCYLVPMWKQVLEFNTHAKEKGALVKELICGKTFERPLGGFIAVSNARRTANWFGHELALANLYGFGRLAWDPNLAPKQVAEEWTRLTFGHDPLVVGTLTEMLLKSWRMYEDYTGPLGAGTFTDAETDYGPALASTQAGGWMPWHGADATGIGKDRTQATGTGFVSQYRPPVAARFESLETCPEELLLFMHRLPYTHVLKSGKTIIQHIYDAHYKGASDAERLLTQWESLKGHVDDKRFQTIGKQLQYQAGHAELWRDAVCNWFLHTSNVADSEGRVGNYPNRFEAESMTLEGYEPQDVKPWETASAGRSARVIEPSGNGAVTMKYEGEGGWYNLNVRYFDENDGRSKFRLLVAGQPVDEWTADDMLPDSKPNGHTSTRRQTRRVALRPGDEIRIEAIADGGERAVIDYLEINSAK